MDLKNQNCFLFLSGLKMQELQGYIYSIKQKLKIAPLYLFYLMVKKTHSSSSLLHVKIPYCQIKLAKYNINVFCLFYFANKITTTTGILVTKEETKSCQLLASFQHLLVDRYKADILKSIDQISQECQFVCSKHDEVWILPLTPHTEQEALVGKILSSLI